MPAKTKTYLTTVGCLRIILHEVGVAKAVAYSATVSFLDVLEC